MKDFRFVNSFSNYSSSSSQSCIWLTYVKLEGGETKKLSSFQPHGPHSQLYSARFAHKPSKDPVAFVLKKTIPTSREAKWVEKTVQGHEERELHDTCNMEVNVNNKLGALALYKQLSFIRAKRLYHYYLNGMGAFRLKLLFPEPLRIL
ncbi:hypothetical protein YC2023_036312 [Brassica napus]